MAPFFQPVTFFLFIFKISTMKRLMNVFKPVAALGLAALLFASCKKNDVNDDVRTPVAGLMAFNLATDKDAVGFTLSGNAIGTQLGYTNYTGAYLPVFTGQREVRSFDYVSGSTLAIANNNFADSNYYSAFLLGVNGNYRNVVVKDELIPLTAASGKAWVRYVNAIADTVAAAPVIKIGTAGEEAIDETAAYASVSAFKQVNAGPVNTSVSNGGNISANRTITLEENKIYTVLFTGLPGQTDNTKTVQVKFIVNGTTTP
jgi:hypothetical protein